MYLIRGKAIFSLSVKLVKLRLSIKHNKPPEYWKTEAKTSHSKGETSRNKE